MRCGSFVQCLCAEPARLCATTPTPLVPFCFGPGCEVKKQFVRMNAFATAENGQDFLAWTVLVPMVMSISAQKGMS